MSTTDSVPAAHSAPANGATAGRAAATGAAATGAAATGAAATGPAAAGPATGAAATGAAATASAGFARWANAQASVRTVAVGGQLIRVAVRPARRRRRSKPAAAPLLLINGIGASLELLQPFVDELDPALEVIRFDVPGVGGSPLPAGPYRFTGLCRLIGRLLGQLGHDSADVLGISWGGAVAQHLAAFQRSRCRKLVLVSTATGMIMVPASLSVLARMATPRRYTDRGYLASVAGELYGGTARTDPARVTAAMNAHNRVGSARGYLYQLGAGLGWTSVPFLPLLRQPTLVLSGDDDPIIPLANARMMHKLIPGSQLHVFHGGHLGLVTEAAQLAPVVCEFLGTPLPQPR